MNKRTKKLKSNTLSFYKKPLYKKPVPFAEKVALKIRNFLGFMKSVMNTLLHLLQEGPDETYE